VVSFTLFLPCHPATVLEWLVFQNCESDPSLMSVGKVGLGGCRRLQWGSLDWVTSKACLVLRRLIISAEIREPLT
jgi:hypothetical protein